MAKPRLRITHHARQRWRWRYEGDDHKEIEDELAIARPASKRVRRQLLSRRSKSRVNDPEGRSSYLVTRDWVFPCYIYPDRIVIMTVLQRKDACV